MAWSDAARASSLATRRAKSKGVRVAKVHRAKRRYPLPVGKSGRKAKREILENQPKISRARYTGKSGLQRVEVGALSVRRAKALQKEFSGKGQDILVRSLNSTWGIKGGFNKRRNTGEMYAVTRNPRTKRATAIMVGERTTTTYGKRGSRDFIVTELFRTGGRKSKASKGTGKVLMGEAAKLVTGTGRLSVHNAVPGANTRFYKKVTGAQLGGERRKGYNDPKTGKWHGARYYEGSPSHPVYSTVAKNKLAKQKTVRVRSKAISEPKGRTRRKRK